MKLLHWLSVLLCLAAPYGTRGLAEAACPAPVRARAVVLLPATPRSLLGQEAAPTQRRAPLAQTTAAKLRYRSAFFIPPIKPCFALAAFARPGAGVDRVFTQLSDDIFHPPA